MVFSYFGCVYLGEWHASLSKSKVTVPHISLDYLYLFLPEQSQIKKSNSLRKSVKRKVRKYVDCACFLFKEKVILLFPFTLLSASMVIIMALNSVSSASLPV